MTVLLRHHHSARLQRATLPSRHRLLGLGLIISWAMLGVTFADEPSAQETLPSKKSKSSAAARQSVTETASDESQKPNHASATPATPPARPAPKNPNKAASKLAINKNAQAKNQASKNVDITPEREQAALKFAEQHHPELVGLITPLKTANSKEYQRAIRDLFRASERLANVRTRDPARYEIDLKGWQLQSQIRLLTARLTMSDDKELEEQLQSLLRLRSDNRLALLRHERQVLQTRLNEIEQQLADAEQHQPALVEQEFARLLKKSSQDRASLKRASQQRPAAKPDRGTAKKTTPTDKPSEESTGQK